MSSLDLSKKELELIVARSTKYRNFEVIGRNIEPFSNHQSGLLGSHYSLTINFKVNNRIIKKVYFMKTCSTLTMVRDLLMDKNLEEEEYQFYDRVHPQLIEDKHIQQWSPRCYLATKDVIVLEDLRLQGYNVLGNHLLDKQSLKSALSTLARFHASSILAERRIGKSFKEQYTNAFEEKIYSQTKFSKINFIGFKTIEWMAEKFGYDSSIVFKIYDRIKNDLKIQKCRCPSVVCHGDLWLNNLLFDQNSPPKCILIDYQLLRYASPVTDVAMLLYLHTTPNFRKKSEFDMFKYYYSALDMHINNNKSEIKVPLSYNSMLQDYQEYKLIGMAYACCYLPSMYMGGSNGFMDLLNDPKKLEEWLLVSRIDIIDECMDKNSDYRCKMEELVKELLQEGNRICNTYENMQQTIPHMLHEFR